MGTVKTTNLQHPDASAAGMILAADGTVSGLRATQNTQSGTTYSLALTDSGRTVTLSNAAAVTVNLPAQATVAWNVGETLSLLNLGVGTVTIAPAADVTINGTPLTLATSKGGSLVRTASNTWTFEPSGGDEPGLKLIVSQAFPTQSTLNFNNCFNSTYNNYKIMFSTTAASAADVALLMRLRVGGVDNSTTAYNTQRLLQSVTSVSGAQNPGAVNTSWTVGVTDSTYPDLCGFEMTLFNPNTSLRTFGFSNVIRWSSVGDPYNEKYGVGFGAAAFDGFSLRTSSGTMSGTIRVYGYQNS